MKTFREFCPFPYWKTTSPCSTEGGEISLTNEEESEAESDSSDENEDNNHIDKLRHELEKAVPGGFQHRQLSMLLRNAQTQHKAIQDRQISGRRRYLERSDQQIAGRSTDYASRRAATNRPRSQRTTGLER